MSSVTPCISHIPRKRTASTSIKSSSSRSSAIFNSLSLICFSNSDKCSARIRPMSRIVVLCRSRCFSILKVTFDVSYHSRLTEWQYQCHSQSVEIFVFSFCSRAAISAFAENSASSLGPGRPKSRRGGRIEEARYAGLREKFKNGLLTEINPGGQTWTRMF